MNSHLVSLSLSLASQTYTQNNHMVVSDSNHIWPHLGYDLIIAFKGSTSMEDLLDDADSNLVKMWEGEEVRVHRGFKRSYEKNKSLIFDSIEKHDPSKILFCGHSLGGALSYLCAMDIMMKQAKHIHADTITFGSPKIGNTEVSLILPEFVDTCHMRVAHVYDPIPKYPFNNKYHHAIPSGLYVGTKNHHAKTRGPLYHHSVRSYRKSLSMKITPLNILKKCLKSF